MKKASQFLMACALFAGCDPKHTLDKAAKDMPITGVVVEYGTHKAIEGVKFVHSECMKKSGGNCVDWRYSDPVYSTKDGTISTTYHDIGAPVSFTHNDYWPYYESATDAIGPTGSDNIPIMKMGTESFEVQLFPVVPVTFHLVNKKLDPDSSATIVQITALVGSEKRAILYPFYLPSVTDTTFTLSGYGNVQNELKVILVKDVSEVYNHLQVFNSRDTVRVEVNY